MLLPFNVNKVFRAYKNGNYIGPIADYLKFFSLLYDEKAIRSGIITREKAVPMTYFATLICLDPDLQEWMELRNHFNHDRVLYIIGVLLNQGCFARDVDFHRLAEYFLSRWKFAWDNDIVFVKYNLRLASGAHPFKAVDDYVAFYWKQASLINKIDPNPIKK